VVGLVLLRVVVHVTRKVAQTPKTVPLALRQSWARRCQHLCLLLHVLLLLLLGVCVTLRRQLVRLLMVHGDARGRQRGRSSSSRKRRNTVPTTPPTTNDRSPPPPVTAAVHTVPAATAAATTSAVASSSVVASSSSSVVAGGVRSEGG